jgi:hypothetical protein
VRRGADAVRYGLQGLIIIIITTDPVAQGLLAVPAVTGQLLQIFIGQPLAHFMEMKSEAWQQQQAKLQLPVVGKEDELVVNAGVQGDAQLNNVGIKVTVRDVVDVCGLHG